MQVLKSLAEAHQHGIIHRDLKPANIMVMQNVVGEDDFVKVLDFGIAKAFGEEGESGALTKTGIGFGTPFYMAPEQVRGKGIQPATDLYALGLVMAEALTGKVVCTGESSMDVAVKQLGAEPPPIPEWVLRGPLGPVIQRATQKDIHQRYPSASEMLRDLRQIDPSISIDVSTKLHTSELPKVQRSRSKVPMVLGALALMFVGLAVVVVAIASLVKFLPGLEGLASGADGAGSDAGVVVAPDLRVTRVEVGTQPEGASVYRADEYLGLTPMTLELDRNSDRRVRLDLRLEGFDDNSVEVSLDRDRSYSVKMEVSDVAEVPDVGSGNDVALVEAVDVSEQDAPGVGKGTGKRAVARGGRKGTGKGGRKGGRRNGNRGGKSARTGGDRDKPESGGGKGKNDGKGRGDSVHVPRL
jgi:hypothetical protein